MDYCTCVITQGGDSRLQVHMPDRKAVSYAEILVLRTVHGGTETVRDLRVVRQEDFTPDNIRALRNLLHAKYGDIVLQIYPGAIPAMPESAADDPHLISGPPKVEEATPPKRGPGRPRKNPEVDFPE